MATYKDALTLSNTILEICGQEDDMATLLSAISAAAGVCIARAVGEHVLPEPDRQELFEQFEKTLMKNYYNILSQIELNYKKDKLS